MRCRRPRSCISRARRRPRCAFPTASKLFAYSGDTEWTDALVGVADGADLFIVECYGYAGALKGHLSWEILKPKLPSLRARRIMLTHMNPSMLAKVEEARAAGLLIAEDGMVMEI